MTDGSAVDRRRRESYESTMLARAIWLTGIPLSWALCLGCAGEGEGRPDEELGDGGFGDVEAGGAEIAARHLLEIIAGGIREDLRWLGLDAAVVRCAIFRWRQPAK